MQRATPGTRTVPSFSYAATFAMTVAPMRSRVAQRIVRAKRKLRDNRLSDASWNNNGRRSPIAPGDADVLVGRASTTG